MGGQDAYFGGRRGREEGGENILVATDVAARGLDVEGVDLVINYELPDDAENYVHRIGRTGRAGHTGLATSLYVPGFDPKTGNGKIAPLLLSQLRACKQTVPGWFSGLPGPPWASLGEPLLEVHGGGGPPWASLGTEYTTPYVWQGNV